MRKLQKLLLSLFKVGCIGFGGGNALIPVIEKEVVKEHKIVSQKDYNKFIVSANTAGYAVGSPVMNLCYDMFRSYVPALILVGSIMTAVFILLQFVITAAHKEKMRIIAEYLLERHGVKYNLKREIYRHETIVKLVAEGDGMAISPCLTPKRLNIQDKFAYFSLDNPVLTRKLVIAYRKNRFLTPPMLNFIQLTREVLDAHPVLAVKDVIPIAPLIYPQF